MKILIPVLVGAVIGYITNWLAIKMLFRPHTEKKIFGFSLPFTPGLIPKERGRIAQNVGETVGTHLLSPATVAEALSSQKIDNQIKQWIEQRIKDILCSTKSIKEMIIELIGIKYENFQNNIEKRLIVFFTGQLRMPYVKDRVFKIIISEVLGRLNEQTFDNLKIKAKLFILKVSTSKEVEGFIKELVREKIDDLRQDGRSLDEIIPQELKNTFKTYLFDNSDKVVDLIREVFSNASFKRGIKDSISNVLKQSSNKVISVFMGLDFISDNISDKIFEVIEDYIEKEENKASIVMTITSVVDKLLQEHVSRIFTVVPDEDMASSINYISEIAMGYITDKENHNKILNITEQRIRDEVPFIKEKLLGFLNSKVDEVLNSPKLEQYLTFIIHESIENIINKPVSYVFKDLDDAAISGTADLIKDIFHNLIDTKAPDIVEHLNIPKVVENQINSFDVAFAEKLIIEIANKELSAITWLGALLGGIMGLLSPLIETLSK